MAMITVICLSFIVLNNFLQTCVRDATREAKGGAPQTKIPPKLPSMPTQTFLTLAAVSTWWLFFGNQQRPRRKVDQIGAMTFLFFWISTENLVKTRPTQKFWPLQKQILPPLEQRSSCGTDMCVKKIMPHQPAEASPHVTDRVKKQLKSTLNVWIEIANL